MKLKPNTLFVEMQCAINKPGCSSRNVPARGIIAAQRIVIGTMFELR